MDTLTEIRTIHNAGRGVIALQPLPSGTVILQSGPPAYHVIFAKYRKETCAFCYLWDRGRSLPVRENDVLKVFCSTECQDSWTIEQGALGLEAWRALASFVKSKGKGMNADQSMGEGLRPSTDSIEAAWEEAKESGELIRGSREGTVATKAERKRVRAILNKSLESVDADMLSYFLCGLLLHHHGSPLVNEVQELAMDAQPYQTDNGLRIGCNSFLQLLSILPLELLPTLTTGFCHAMVQADNHNAFGIRGGGEDSEEYMGYAVYPSASYFNHSCNPNLTKRRIGRSWEFAAAREIEAGEECCITYLGGDEKGLDRADRQRRLKEVWDFECGCERCRNEAIT
jgi:SET and MYND domain-containing protein